jgi:hypothetical protein
MSACIAVNRASNIVNNNRVDEADIRSCGNYAPVNDGGRPVGMRRI